MPCLANFDVAVNVAIYIDGQRLRGLTSRRSQPPLALAVPLSRFTSRVGGGSAFFVRPLRARHTNENGTKDFSDRADGSDVRLWLFSGTRACRPAVASQLCRVSDAFHSHPTRRRLLGVFCQFYQPSVIFRSDRSSVCFHHSQFGRFDTRRGSPCRARRSPTVLHIPHSGGLLDHLPPHRRLMDLAPRTSHSFVHHVPLAPQAVAIFSAWREDCFAFHFYHVTSLTSGLTRRRSQPGLSLSVTR